MNNKDSRDNSFHISMKDVAHFTEQCPDCEASIGELHGDGCDVEACPECGGQFVSCDCELTVPRLPWTGYWPGSAECLEFGWYSKFVTGDGWVSCDKDDPQMYSVNLNRLGVDAKWDKSQGRFIKC